MKKRTLQLQKLAWAAGLSLTVCLFCGAAFAEEETDEAVFEELIENITEEETDLSAEPAEPAGPPEYDASQCVDLGQYLGLSLDPIEVTVTDGEVDMTIENLVRSNDLYDVATEGTVAEGDIANIDYVGKKDDVAFDGGTAEGFDLEIGSGTFIEGFEEGLVGANIGETVDLNLTFPEQYGNADLAGQDVVFTVTVNSVKRMPEISDETAAKLSDGEYDNLEEYREYIRQDLAGQMRDEESELVNQIVAGCERIEVPSDLLDYYVQEEISYAEQMYAYYGMTLEDALTGYYGTTLEEYTEQVRQSVSENLEKQLVVEAIVKAENLEVSDEELADEAEELALQYNYGSGEQLLAIAGEDAVRDRAAFEKAIALIVENAEIGEITILTEYPEAEESVEEIATETAEETVTE